MNLRLEVMRAEVPGWALLLALVLAPVTCDSICERGKTWWKREVGACVPCTRCDASRPAVRYPCELHRDTICQSLYDIPIWPFNTNKLKNDTVSEYDYYEYADEYGEVSDSDGVTWDLQTSTLTLATSGCIVFFVVVLSLSLYHAKQWKKLKKALQSDVQDLSAKLKLMEAGESPTEPVSATDHHIYCNIQLTKDGLLGTVPCSKIGLGNVYTQEKHAS